MIQQNFKSLRNISSLIGRKETIVQNVILPLKLMQINGKEMFYLL